MKKGAKVLLKKLRPSPNPDCPTPELVDYRPGTITVIPFSTGQVVAEVDLPNEGKSIPVEYEVKGELLADIKAGSSISMLRTHRNGVEVLGLFDTSVLVQVSPQPDGTVQLETANSIYRLEVVG